MNAILVTLVLAQIIVSINCQSEETCGRRNRTCTADQCCIRIMRFGRCAPLRRENSRCGYKFQCPCSPGLECVTRGNSSRGRCRSSTSSTTSTSTTISTTWTTPTTSTFSTSTETGITTQIPTGMPTEITPEIIIPSTTTPATTTP